MGVPSGLYSNSSSAGGGGGGLNTVGAGREVLIELLAMATYAIGDVVATVMGGGEVMDEDMICWGGVMVPASGSRELVCSTTPCISDFSASDWFFLFFLLLPDLAFPETGAETGVAAEGVGGLGGLVLPPDFTFFLGQEEELCPTILQVRQVLGARGHQARTFVPKTSKMVGGLVDGLTSMIRSQRRVSQGLPGIR